MCELSKKYIMRITGKNNLLKTVYVNSIEELFSKINSLGYDIEMEKEEIVTWIQRAYPTCKLFLQNFSLEWMGNIKTKTC